MKQQRERRGWESGGEEERGEERRGRGGEEPEVFDESEAAIRNSETASVQTRDGEFCRWRER